jgi:hypothetical protein
MDGLQAGPQGVVLSDPFGFRNAAPKCWQHRIVAPRERAADGCRRQLTSH